MYNVKPTTRFKKDMKSLVKRGYDVSLISSVVTTLAAGKKLDQKHQDHALSGKWIGYRDCHITPDWILIYKIDKKTLILVLTRTGTHSDLELD